MLPVLEDWEKLQTDGRCGGTIRELCVMFKNRGTSYARIHRTAAYGYK